MKGKERKGKEETKNEDRKPDKNLSLRRLEFMPINHDYKYRSRISPLDSMYFAGHKFPTGSGYLLTALGELGGRVRWVLRAEDEHNILCD